MLRVDLHDQVDVLGIKVCFATRKPCKTDDGSCGKVCPSECVLLFYDKDIYVAHDSTHVYLFFAQSETKHAVTQRPPPKCSPLPPSQLRLDPPWPQALQ